MQTFDFQLCDDYVELIKLLKVVGITDTGGMAKNLVDDRQVKVDGHVECRKRCKIRRGQIVEVGDYRVTVH